MSGTGIRQISHRFKSQTGLLLFSPITDIFGSLSRSISLSKHTPLKSRSYYTVSQSSLMFKGDCLSLNINNSNAFLSRYVMLCHAFRHAQCFESKIKQRWKICVFNNKNISIPCSIVMLISIAPNKCKSNTQTVPYFCSDVFHPIT